MEVKIIQFVKVFRVKDFLKIFLFLFIIIIIFILEFS
jgi:hypothetical protein